MDLLIALLISIASTLGITQDQAKETTQFRQEVENQKRDGFINDNEIATLLSN